MMYVLKENRSGLYVGTHSNKICALKEKEQAYIFVNEEDLKESLDMLKELAHLDLTAEPHHD